MRRRSSASVALLLCVLAAWSCTAQQKQSQHDFLAVLIDATSKKPVPSARLILAPKKEGKHECTIDTSLTGVSNERGEVRIPNVGPGEYVVFYNLSASLSSGLNGMVVNYFRVGNDDYVEAIAKSLGVPGLLVLKGSTIGIVEGLISVETGYMYAERFDLAMIVSGGELRTVRISSAGSAPVTIEINTDLPPSSPPRGAPKTGQ